ncbi:MAG: hypothetical protein RLZZ248_343 [Bacteroidota bacterium]
MFHIDPSPLQTYSTPASQQQGLTLLIKMDHLRYLSAYPEDQALGGNKLRKLKFNIEDALRQKKGLLTFGGAFSNHIAAVASAGQWFQIPTIGIIRGEDHTNHNPTLQHAQRCGMKLQFINRTHYRLKSDPQYLSSLQKENPNYIIIPEGGTNDLALKGVGEIVREINQQIPHAPIDYWITPVGTGGTLAGLITHLPRDSFAVGISVLKGDFLTREVQQLVKSPSIANWEIIPDYHFGGYAKWTPTLIAYMRTLRQATRILTDPVYTSKLFYAVEDLIAKNYFKKNSTIMIVHTGGIQGIKGFQTQWPHVIL